MKKERRELRKNKFRAQGKSLIFVCGMKLPEFGKVATEALGLCKQRLMGDSSPILNGSGHSDHI